MRLQVLNVCKRLNIYSHAFCFNSVRQFNSYFICRKLVHYNSFQMRPLMKLARRITLQYDVLFCIFLGGFEVSLILIKMIIVMWHQSILLAMELLTHFRI